MQPTSGRIAKRIITGLLAAAALVLVFQLYVSGNPALAAATMGACALAFFVYTARRAYTYRYLFPGLAGIALFIVVPLAYTVWIGFTNYSSRNLLTFERATDVVLSEVYQVDTVRYQFTLHAAGSGFRLVLHNADDDAGAGSTEANVIDDTGGSVIGSEAGSGAAAGSGSSATGSGSSAGSGSAAPAAPPRPTTFVSAVLPLDGTVAHRADVVPLAGSGVEPGEELPLKDVIAHRDAIHAITVHFPDGTSAAMASLREFTPYQPRYQRNADGSLTDHQSGERVVANMTTGFYETASGKQLQPGFRVTVGFDNYTRVFGDAKFRGPFVRVFVWTVVFAALTVLFTSVVGMLIAELLSWERLRFAWLYRVLLFLPYAVPSFISILVFKGLFNRNFGEINLILNAVFGIRPNWIGDAMLARLMILIVNTWLGYPYIMLLCMGLQKSVPSDLYEASALAGAGPLTNFLQITWPLIRKPLSPLLISSFAFNFNNFVLIYLLTQGRPDFLNTNVPAGETDILASYTYRIAFEDSGQNFGLASAISTLVFAMVAVLSLINLRLTRANAQDKR